MASTMLAWRKHLGTLEPVLEEVPIPQAPKDGFLLKVLAAGVCHSDWALVRRETPPAHYQDKYTLGHEGCGEIIEIGSGVKDGAWKIGDLVAVFPVPGCGGRDCPECSHGNPQICSRGEHYGIGNDGSFAPFIAINSRAAVRLPNGVSPAQGAVATDAVMTAYHAVIRRGEVKRGEVVFLIGLGGLGFNALQIALSTGARVIVSDKREAVLKEAVRFGVPLKDVVPAGKSIREFVVENDLLIDTVIDFVGMAETSSDAQEIVRPGGKIVGVGLLGPELKLDNLRCIQKRLTYLFSYGGQIEDVVECLDLISKKSLLPQVEIGSLKDLPTVLNDLHHGKIKSRMALIPK